MKTYYDISVTLGRENITFPGDMPFSRGWDLKMEDGGKCNLSHISLSIHAGTHLDFPFHFIPGGKTAEEYAPERFIMPAQVVEIMDENLVTMKELSGRKIKKNHAVLLKTRNSREGLIVSGKYATDFVSLEEEAGRFLIDNDALLVGIDYITVEKSVGGKHPVHEALLGNNIFIMESINLKHVPPGTYTLICLPLKIAGSEGSPVRAVLY
ncbi:MAG: cyclase family protein [Spirochaetales bacterium]|nr:cyclase family protein [Spirochaetales bacterium]